MYQMKYKNWNSQINFVLKRYAGLSKTYKSLHREISAFRNKHFSHELSNFSFMDGRENNVEGDKGYERKVLLFLQENKFHGGHKNPEVQFQLEWTKGGVANKWIMITR